VNREKKELVKALRELAAKKLFPQMCDELGTFLDDAKAFIARMEAKNQKEAE